MESVSAQPRKEAEISHPGMARFSGFTGGPHRRQTLVHLAFHRQRSGLIGEDSVGEVVPEN